MKKTILPAILAATFGAIALAPQQAAAANGKITFTGAISDTTCTVTGGGNAAGTGDITVSMPTVSKTALDAVGATAGDTPFSLVLGGGANCTNGKTASLWIETSLTPSLDTATGALKNTGTAAAVQVRLVNPANNNPIKLNINTPVTSGATVVSTSNQPAATISGNTATLNYAAQYLNPTTQGAVTAGSVSTYLTYSMQYN
jgi:major type 1 subunit fimbrin (pilin)